MMLRVLEPGLFTTVQDLGRRGYERDGIPCGGAMDRFAIRVANLLVGNEEGDAALEVTLGGLALRFEEEGLVALAGADLVASADGVAIPAWHAAWLPAGSRLSFGGPGAGCRAYLAVAGGIAVPPVLGSRSTLARAGMGGLDGRPLRRGDELSAGSASPLSGRIAATLREGAGGPLVSPTGPGISLRPAYSTRPAVRLLSGADADALSAGPPGGLYGSEFQVGPDSDRMGYRLHGPRLETAAAGDRLSEPVAFGTVQLPPGGHPIVLMADRQTTGGYPRIGEIATVDLPLLAQLKPGDSLRFRPCLLAEAHELLVSRERGMEKLRAAISLRYA